MENTIETNENDLAKQQLNQIIDECNAKLKSISEIENNATLRKNEVDAELKSLSETSNSSFSSILQDLEVTKTEANGKAKKVSDLLDEVIEKHNTLDSHYNEFINKPGDQEPSKVERVSSAYQKIIENETNSEKIHSKLKEYDVTLFGNQDANIVGIKDRMEEYENDVKKKRTEWEESYNTLYKKVEGLLPAATSTGLAFAYQAIMLDSYYSNLL